MAGARYPFVPKSTSSLRPGDFWAVPRADGSFACGRVLQTEGEYLVSPRKAFFGSLLDWIGDSAPTADSIAGAPVLRSGIMHIKAIVSTGGEVLGNRPLDADGLVPPTLLSAHGGNDTWILRGVVSVRRARPDEWGTFPVLGYWGLDFISALAEADLTAP